MQKIITTALVAGCLAGLFSFGVQSVKLTPLILQAEEYENADAARQEVAEHTMQAAHAHEHAHEADAWEPENGVERNAYRLLADIGMGVGFALMLVGAFAWRAEPMDARRGILWGLAGFTVFSLAPTFGLPPELPATMAGNLEMRQLWWLATVLSTAISLYLLVFGRSGFLKIMGILLLAFPHVIGAPKAPLGGITPTELNAQFAAASLVTMALFWVVLGGISGWFYGRDYSPATK